MRARRLRKKRHAQCVVDVLVGVIDSDSLAPTIRQLDLGQSLGIARAESVLLDEGARSLIRRWELRFKLTRVPKSDAPEDPYPVEGAWLLRLEALEFPTVVAWAEEFPEHLGSWRPGAPG